MCLRLDYQKTKFKIAKRTLVVYKTGYRDLKTFKSRYRGFSYILNQKQPRVRIKKEMFGRIYEGYHSFNTLIGAKVSRYDSYNKIGKFIIPKGTKYYEGTNYGYKNRVSETIIFKGFIK